MKADPLTAVVCRERLLQYSRKRNGFRNPGHGAEWPRSKSGEHLIDATTASDFHLLPWLTFCLVP